MTENSDHLTKPNKRKRSCLIAIGVVLFLILLLFIIALILALTVFKTKQPRTQILSASVDGVAPRISFPAVQIELNITLDLMILVENRNHASFKHGTGKTFLLYQGNQVGDADLYPGFIPARGNSTLPCRLTLQADRLANNMSNLISDVLGGEFVLETRTRIPGRVTLLGFIKKHAVAVSECQLTIGFPDMTVKRQVCKSKAKL
ncbi:hypothetical protein PRUPE_6G299100 [Prunus persica]|uniref:PREDICTED: late embryogenesis abundant n=2 Tax=Prunus TaxID=3754 RepID=A0A5E4EKS8_PRUDU|nr:uncharacterized protein LOC18772738 [Prunus persica]XP_034218511.1 uncharacterized protein LOC117629942 [Prunus dulcis]KAI5326151.1 hypothetical protein L3X38_035225 [Prunus dulcis]ONI04050.1 hypothetical protein PRUPE_6G299100 [Prunus persica]VVA14488.1 PREDICTED: late embryogenesis abundant [Prunus dulcis]